MDCVGCEKCRLWGKLQILGLGTALKILFSVDSKNHPNKPVSLMQLRDLYILLKIGSCILLVKHFSRINAYWMSLAAATAKKRSDCFSEPSSSTLRIC